VSDILHLNRNDYLDLKRHYEQAVKDGKTQFTWRERELLVAYAKYLLEYLDIELKK
jgi:hypothetical protein